MAGLGVLLEAQHHPLSKGPQIINKFKLVSCSSTSSASSPSPHPHPPPMPTSSFLESCFLCGKRLSQGRDIYMYQGDRAFCSVECRCRHITMDEQSMKREKCSGAASRHRGKAASRWFTY